MPLRIATFNCENLFARFRFEDGVNPQNVSRDGWEIDQTLFDVNRPEDRKITGQAIKAANADIVALQEVENLDVLKRFRTDHLGGFKAYPYAVLIEGNDLRLIDVAVLSRWPIVHVRSYAQLRASPSARSFTFSRDCLEVDVEVNAKRITLFVNHFKSMMGGRAETRDRRKAQAATVMEIVKGRFGASPGEKPWVVVGDLNDYLETDAAGSSGITDLAQWNQVENVVARLPAEQRWTHFWDDEKAYRQLDYVLVSKSLKPAVKKVDIVRKGLPLAATEYTGPRFPGVGEKSPKASDHCPVVVEMEW